MTFSLVHHSYTSSEGQAGKLVFFAPRYAVSYALDGNQSTSKEKANISRGI